MHQVGRRPRTTVAVLPRPAFRTIGRRANSSRSAAPLRRIDGWKRAKQHVAIPGFSARPESRKGAQRRRSRRKHVHFARQHARKYAGATRSSRQGPGKLYFGGLRARAPGAQTIAQSRQLAFERRHELFAPENGAGGNRRSAQFDLQFAAGYYRLKPCIQLVGQLLLRNGKLQRVEARSGYKAARCISSHCGAQVTQTRDGR